MPVYDEYQLAQSLASVPIVLLLIGRAELDLDGIGQDCVLLLHEPREHSAAL